jgi:diacylglycerol kinase
MTNKTFSYRDRLKSMLYAWHGIKRFFQQEHNAWIHLAATIVVFFMTLYYNVRGTELLAVVVVAGMVWVSEIFNTVIEKIMDHISPDRHPRVEFIKDLSASAVMLSALTAVLTGIIVFLPKIV